MAMAMPNVTDVVMRQIIKEARKGLEKQSTEELKAAKASAAQWRRDYQSLRRDHDKMELRLEKIEQREKAVKIGAAKVLRLLGKLKQLRQRKLTSFLDDGWSSYQTMEKEARALRQLRAVTKATK